MNKQKDNTKYRVAFATENIQARQSEVARTFKRENMDGNWKTWETLSLKCFSLISITVVNHTKYLI